MAKVKIGKLNPAGWDLLRDPESFLQALEENEMEAIAGGYGGSYYSNWVGIQSIKIEGKYSVNLDLKDLRKHYGRSIVGNYGNSVRNNSVNGYTYNANSYSNFNTVA